MKKSIHKILRAAGLGLVAVAMAGLTACTSEDNMTTQPTPQTAPVYQVSIPAGFADGTSGTRAVSYNDVTGGLDATFKTTDDIHVYNVTKQVEARDNEYNPKSLHPDADGATAKLVGELTFYNHPSYKTVEVDDVLVLSNNKDGKIYYNDDGRVNSQSGTLANLNFFDYASCEVRITGISGAGTPDDPYTLTTSKASFENAQSMFKFTFTGLPRGTGVQTVTIHSAGNKLVSTYNPSSASPNDYGDVTIDFRSTIDEYREDARRRANGPGVVYAALRFDALGASETDDITFTVTDYADGNIYTATKTSPVGGFANGNYYTSTIALTLSPFNLSNITSGGYYYIKDGITMTGTLTENAEIIIHHGATVTLDGVTINGTNDEDYPWAGITCDGDATIILNGTNTVKGFYDSYPGIYVPEGKKLIIKGSGSLNASSNGAAAGIGGGCYIDCGDIEIQGGSITATGGDNAAGIGTGLDGSCGTISISGGSITATGGYKAAGIGCGTNGSCGAITITSDVTHVTATKGTDAPYSIGKGVGNTSRTGTITIEDPSKVTQN